MTDRDTFADRQVQFQLGQCEVTAGLSRALQMEAGARGSLFMCYEPEGRALLPQGKWDTLRRETVDGRETWFHDRSVGLKLGYRNTEFLNSILSYGPTRPLFVDMQDAVYRGATDENASVVPVFQYNRVKGAKNAVLWPLTKIQDIGTRTFVGGPIKDRIRFGKKQPAVFWRGELVGVSTAKPRRANIQWVVREFCEGKIDEDDLLAHLSTISRYRFLKRFFGHPRFNVAIYITDATPSYAKVSEVARFAGEFVRPRDQLHYRYLLALAGNDVATSFIWGAATNSVVLKEEYAWETFYSCHFRPWVHYVPISPDFDDLLDKLEWCDQHPADCERMTEESQAMCQLLADRQLRTEILGRVAEGYQALFPEQYAAVG